MVMDSDIHRTVSADHRDEASADSVPRQNCVTHIVLVWVGADRWVEFIHEGQVQVERELCAGDGCVESPFREYHTEVVGRGGTDTREHRRVMVDGHLFCVYVHGGSVVGDDVYRSRMRSTATTAASSTTSSASDTAIPTAQP